MRCLFVSLSPRLPFHLPAGKRHDTPSTFLHASIPFLEFVILDLFSFLLFCFLLFFVCWLGKRLDIGSLEENQPFGVPVHRGLGRSGELKTVNFWAKRRGERERG